MKFLGVLLLGMLLGALVYREFGERRAPALATGQECASACASAESSTSHDLSSSRPVSAAAAPPLDSESAAATARIGDTTPVASQAAAVAPEQLLVPVEGKTANDLTDTFTDARSQGRSHDAIDIMAQAGTPVLAVADGHVEKLFDSKLGGLTIYQFEPSGKFAYYYAHLQRYADGLAEKQAVRRGQVIGYVGSTGNASADAPHLHFAIFVLGPERRWWEGAAVNPYPVLKGK